MKVQASDMPGVCCRSAEAKEEEEAIDEVNFTIFHVELCCDGLPAQRQGRLWQASANDFELIMGSNM